MDRGTGLPGTGRWRTRTVLFVAAFGLVFVSALGAESDSSATYCPEGQPSACIRATANDMTQRLESLRCDHDSAFALLYLRVTEAILAAVEDDVFEHDGYIADMDVVFADYYFRAFEDWHDDTDATTAPPAWRVAFRSAEDQQVTGLGNILLGINAHIRNDLPFVIEELGVRRGGESMEGSYNRVDEVLRGMYVDARAEAARRLSPTIDDVDLASTSLDEDSLFTLVRGARREAWQMGIRLLEASTDVERNAIAEEIRANAYQSALDYRATFDYTTRNYTAQERNAYCDANFDSE